MCWSQRFGGEDLLCGAQFASPERRDRSCWTRGNKLFQEWLKQSAHFLPKLLVHRANQWASMDVCDKKRGRCGAIMNYFQDEREEERYYHDQLKSHSDCRGCLYQRGRGRCLSEMRPRTSRLQHRFGADLALPWVESRRNTPCTLIKACYDGAVVPGGLRSTNRTGGGSLTSGSGGPGRLPRRDDGTQDPPPVNDWTAQVQALAANPAWAQFAPWQLLHQQHQHLRYQQQLVAASTTDPWQVLPEDGGSTGAGGVWTREQIGLVCNRPIQHNVSVRKHESSTGLVW